MVKTVSKELKEKPHIQSVHGSLENAIDPTTQRILEEQIRNSNDPKLQQLEAKLQKVESQRRAVEDERLARSFSTENAPNPAQNIENRGRGLSYQGPCTKDCYRQNEEERTFSRRKEGKVLLWGT